MRIERCNYYQGGVKLEINEFLVATRVVKPDYNKVPLHDQFDLPLWFGKAKCTTSETKAYNACRQQHLEDAERLLLGSAISMTSSAQKMMKHGLEPMLLFTDHDVLMSGNSTVILRARIRPTSEVEDMEGLEAYPFLRKQGLSRLVLYRPRLGYHGPLPGYVPFPDERGYDVLEVMGFQVGREGLKGMGVRGLTFPKLRTSRVLRCKSDIL